MFQRDMSVSHSLSGTALMAAFFIVAGIAGSGAFAQMVLSMNGAYRGADWATGVVKSVGDHELTLFLSKDNSLSVNEDTTLSISVPNDTTLCIDKHEVPFSSQHLREGFKEGTLISAKFTSLPAGGLSAVSLVNRGYDMIMGMSSPTSGYSNGPNFPKCSWE